MKDISLLVVSSSTSEQSVPDSLVAVAKTNRIGFLTDARCATMALFLNDAAQIPMPPTANNRWTQIVPHVINRIQCRNGTPAACTKRVVLMDTPSSLSFDIISANMTKDIVIYHSCGAAKMHPKIRAVV